MSDRDRSFGDAVYETWRRGGNPDEVDRDSLAGYEADGYTPYEAVEMEVERVTRRRPTQENGDGD